MFAGKTMVVVGAGASKEAGLPTGAELKATISELLDFRFEGRKLVDGDGTIFKALERYAHDDQNRNAIHQYIRSAHLISEAMPTAKSIDHFLNSHKGNRHVEICGKLAIAKAILDAERESKLFVSFETGYDRLHLATLTGTWYLKLAELMFSCQIEELEERLSKIKFIVFNYDRCIEHFLLWGLQIYFGLEETEAAQYVNTVKIYHPYGSVGRLPWQDKPGASAVAFGSKDYEYDLAAVAGQLKTFTEGMDPNSSDILELREALHRSSIVIFLGFGFHQLNMELITPVERKALVGAVTYYATASGLSEHNRAVADTRIRGLSAVNPKQLHICNLYCGQLFQEFYFSLDM